jgi:AcrR family transcriptional regulator
MSQPRAPGTDRRVRRTERALRDALVTLVIERGYDKVSVEDIAERADVARATFYAHYAGKDELLTLVFTELVDDVMDRLTLREGPWDVARTRMVHESYRHAAELRDLYRACLSGAGDGRARDAYRSALINSVEVNFSERLRNLGNAPGVPLEVMSRVFAGAHMTLLIAWLDGELDYSADEMATMEVRTLLFGLGWAFGLSPDQMSLDTADGGGADWSAAEGGTADGGQE